VFACMIQYVVTGIIQYQYIEYIFRVIMGRRRKQSEIIFSFIIFMRTI
jgi:hypothetical protein